MHVWETKRARRALEETAFEPPRLLMKMPPRSSALRCRVSSGRHGHQGRATTQTAVGSGGAGGAAGGRGVGMRGLPFVTHDMYW